MKRYQLCMFACPCRRAPAPGEGLSASDREARAIRARAVYERGFRSIREGSPDAKEEAVMLLEAWRDFEAKCSEFRYGVVWAVIPKSSCLVLSLRMTMLHAADLLSATQFK